ncbi:MAG: DUF2892 domain-containing protein [Gammaproteobacteria bacterium]|nr:DUF2892 domain-containing protein [Gammaproteobacteria bacterium]
MKQNMGYSDRVIRLLVAIGIAGLYFTGTISGTTALVLSIIAIVLLLTSLVGVCPAYLPFKLSTRRPRHAGQKSSHAH